MPPRGWFSPIVPRLEAKTIVDADSGCWLWQGCPDRDGYGSIMWRGVHWRVHRVVYTLLRGPIPDGLQLDHLCRTPSCVNPNHLEPVTCRENLMRGDTHAARNAAREGCRYGHGPYDYTTPDGKRQCKRCAAERNRRLRARRRST